MEREGRGEGEMEGRRGSEARGMGRGGEMEENGRGEGG